MEPLKAYQQDLDAGHIQRDPLQQEVIQVLQRVYLQLQQQHKGFFAPFKKIFGLEHEGPIKGLYVWGGVGIGKTYLMDLFYHHLPGQRKTRMHFHGFMYEVQERLKALQGQQNPLELIAKEIAKDSDVLCFDEFFVSDIGDAMILGGLLTQLFEYGVVLIATSNVEPCQLYKNGLQRSRFIPAIQQITAHTQVMHLASEKDYRLRNLQQSGVFFTPVDETTKQAMIQCFERLAHGDMKKDVTIMVENREITAKALAANVIWFDFNVICNIPRSQNDYLVIARQYPMVMVSGIPKIGPKDHAQATYLINLVDVFYDANVKLIVSSEVPLEDIYLEGSKVFEFERTKSRLIEMQTEEYLSREHITSVG